MKVILTEEVPNLGAPGQVVEVAPGYARHYLLPRKLAIEATRGNVSSLEHHRRTIEARQKKLAQSASALGERIASTPIAIAARAGETGRLYGSITTADIAAELERALGLQVDKRKIEILEPIKVLGDYQVKLRLHRDVQVPLTVTVVPEGPPRGQEQAETQVPAEPVEGERAAAPSEQQAQAPVEGASENSQQ
jgi:large subunit ribosomal protein L9